MERPASENGAGLFYMKKKQNEKKNVTNPLMERLRAEVGGFWWKVHGGMFQITGNPDICGCVQGLYIAIEAKDGKNSTSGVQDTRIQQITESGGLAFATWDVDSAVRKVKRHVKNFTLQKAEDSRKVIRKKKSARIIHGAGDWEDSDQFIARRPKTKKKK